MFFPVKLTNQAVIVPVSTKNYINYCRTGLKCVLKHCQVLVPTVTHRPTHRPTAATPVVTQSAPGSGRLWSKPPSGPQSAHLDQLVEVGVLARRVLVLVEEVVHGLRAQQQLHLPLLVVEGSVVLLRQAADVGHPEGGGGGPFTQQVEGQRHVAHRLQDPVLLVQRP